MSYWETAPLRKTSLAPGDQVGGFVFFEIDDLSSAMNREKGLASSRKKNGNALYITKDENTGRHVQVYAEGDIETAYLNTCLLIEDEKDCFSYKVKES